MFAQPRSFPCPNCKEMINDQMIQCRFCSVPIDPGVAALVAERQQQTNQACSDASYLKTTAGAMFVFLALSLIPFMPLVSWAFLITFIVAVVLLIRWQVKFGSLITSDPDYQRAKRSKNIALLLVIAAAPLGFVVRPLIGVLLAQVF